MEHYSQDLIEQSRKERRKMRRQLFMLQATVILQIFSFSLYVIMKLQDIGIIPPFFP